MVSEAITVHFVCQLQATLSDWLQVNQSTEVQIHHLIASVSDRATGGMVLTDRMASRNCTSQNCPRKKR